MNLPAPLSFRDALRVLWRHKGKGIIVFLLVVLAGNLYNAFAPRLYHSEAKLFIRLGRENAALDPVASGGQGSVVAVPQLREQEINSVVEILRSRILLEQVVDGLGAEQLLGLGDDAPDVPKAATATSGADTKTSPDDAAGAAEAGWLNKLNPFSIVNVREQAIRRLQKTLSVEAIKKSNVIAIGFDSARPQLSQRVLTTLLDRFLRQYIEANRTTQSEPFFVRQTDALSKQVAEQEDALRQLKERTGLASGEERKRIVVDRIGKLEDEQLSVNLNLAAARSEMAAIESSLAQLPATLPTSKTSGLANESHDLMRSQLYALELKQKELESKFQSQHPEVQLVKQQVDEAKRILAKEDSSRSSVTEGSSRIYEQAEINRLTQQQQLASLQVKAERLKGQLADAREQLVALTTDELHVKRLERELAINEANYRRYRDNLEYSRIDHDLDTARISNISVFQPASFEPQPSSPRRLLNLALSLLGGLFAGLGCILLAEQFDHSLKTDDVERVSNEPLLGAIPRSHALANGGRPGR